MIPDERVLEPLVRGDPGRGTLAALSSPIFSGFPLSGSERWTTRTATFCFRAQSSSHRIAAVRDTSRYSKRSRTQLLRDAHQSCMGVYGFGRFRRRSQVPGSRGRRTQSAHSSPPFQTDLGTFAAGRAVKRIATQEATGMSGGTAGEMHL